MSTAGPIDYLIVGSGPAGSVLAHELRRGGKNVLLVERGSFVVPGSMESPRLDDLIDTRTSDDGAIRISNGMAVGGGSQVNVDLCFAPTTPAIQAKINGWRQDGRIGPKDFTKDQVALAYEWVKVQLHLFDGKERREKSVMYSEQWVHCCGWRRLGQLGGSAARDDYKRKQETASMHANQCSGSSRKMINTR